MIKSILKKMKSVWNTTTKSPKTIKIVSLVVCSILMVLPFGMDKMDLFNCSYIPKLFYPFTVLTSGIVPKTFRFFYISCFTFYLLPVTFTLTFISLFKKKIAQSIITACNFITVTLYLSTSITGMILFANTIRWYQ